jgi:hypothetical protein
MERSDYYVYALLRPPRCGGPGPYSPFYIGKGRGDRARQHAFLSKTERGHKAAICRKLRAEFGYVPHVILRSALVEKEAFEWERLFVFLYGRNGKEWGPLTNLTDGGEGSSGYIMTDETREKLVAILRIANATPEARAKKSAGLKRHCQLPEAKASRSRGCRVMHEKLGPGWVAERNRRVGSEKIASLEPLIRQARVLKSQGISGAAAKRILGLKGTSIYFYYLDRFSYLDPVATEPTASIAA